MLFFEKSVRKIHEAFPVIWLDIMLSRPDVVTYRTGYRLLQTRKFKSRKPLFSQQPIDRRGSHTGEKFPFWIRPAILFGTADIKRTWSNQRQQFVLINS